jgi:aminopeptidase N
MKLWLLGFLINPLQLNMPTGIWYCIYNLFFLIIDINCLIKIQQELQALTEEVIPVMWDDAKPSSHPVVVRNVTSPADIISIFDSITYSKGASILRMLEKIVGSNTFRDGLRDYLSINAFDVGDPSIFYNKLFTNISGEAFMKNWLEELNYPILNVHLKTDNNGTSVTFNQSRFIISNALDASNLTSDYRWKINMECVLGKHFSFLKIFKLSYFF